VLDGAGGARQALRPLDGSIRALAGRRVVKDMLD
jgi:hypothetical protein